MTIKQYAKFQDFICSSSAEKYFYHDMRGAEVRPALFDELTSLTGILFMGHIGKQYSPRCDAAECRVPTASILFAKMIFIKINVKIKNHP